MGKEEENSNQGVQNPLYADAESSETSGPGHSNPPEYNQVNQVLQQGNIAPMTILPGQIQVQPGQPQFTSQPQYQYVNQPTYAAQPTQMTAQPTQMIQPGVVQGNAMVQNAPQVVYVTSGLCASSRLCPAKSTRLDANTSTAGTTSCLYPESRCQSCSWNI